MCTHRAPVSSLTPQPGVLPDFKKPKSSPTGRGGGARTSSSSSPSANSPAESFLRQALFNGGCSDVIVVPGAGSGGGRGKSGSRATSGGGGGRSTAATRNAPATEAWPQLSTELGAVTVHLPVDNNNPFGRSLRVSVGGVTARDLVSSAAATAAAADGSHGSGGGGGGRRSSFTSSSARRLGVDTAVATVSAVWTRGVPPAAAAAAAAEAKSEGGGSSRSGNAGSRLLPLRRRGGGGGGGGSRQGADGSWTARSAPELYSVEGEDPVVLDVRDPVAVKIRLVDEGSCSARATATAVPAGGAPEHGRGSAASATGGGVGLGRNESIFTAAGGGGMTDDDEMGVASLFPAVVREVSPEPHHHIVYQPGGDG